MKKNPGRSSESLSWMGGQAILLVLLVLPGCTDQDSPQRSDGGGGALTPSGAGGTGISSNLGGALNGGSGASPGTSGAGAAGVGGTHNQDRPAYYVSIDGDDGGPGTAEQPWRTIQHAADTVGAGDLVLVADGNYEERVLLSRGGEEGARIEFQAIHLHGAKVRSLVVRGDYMDVSGFEVEADLSEPTGVFVDGSRFVSIRDCYVHDCPLGGIDVSGTSIDGLSSDVEVTGNHLQHNGQWGVHVVGSRVLVEDNEVSDTVQHHPKGDPAGFTGADADGMRIFGDQHTIRGNYIHGIADPSDAEHNIDPHADCIQTWDRQSVGGRPVMTNTVIERNRCVVSHTSGKGIMMSAINGDACHHITIRNNVFEFRDEGIEASEGAFHDIYIYNNLFKAYLDDPPWGTSIHLGESANNYDVRNNIMVDCHAEVRKISSEEGTVDYNLVWYSNGATPSGTPGPQAHEIWGEDPLFVSYDGEAGGDYRLQAGSPAIDAGASLSEVSDDLEGNPRPRGGSHDIGPFEY